MTINVHTERAALGLTWTELAEHFRDQSKRCHQASLDSFDRCDTDGFLSQWASDTTAAEYRAAADLADNEGRTDFQALFDLDGNLIPARCVETRYGWSWVYDDEDGNSHWFSESHAKKGATRKANDAKKGYQLGSVNQKAYVTLGGGGYSLYPVYRPLDEPDTRPVLDNRWYQD